MEGHLPSQLVTHNRSTIYMCMLCLDWFVPDVGCKVMERTATVHFRSSPNDAICWAWNFRFFPSAFKFAILAFSLSERTGKVSEGRAPEAFISGRATGRWPAFSTPGKANSCSNRGGTKRLPQGPRKFPWATWLIDQAVYLRCVKHRENETSTKCVLPLRSAIPRPAWK